MNGISPAVLWFNLLNSFKLEVFVNVSRNIIEFGSVLKQLIDCRTDMFDEL